MSGSDPIKFPKSETGLFLYLLRCNTNHPTDYRRWLGHTPQRPEYMASIFLGSPLQTDRNNALVGVFPLLKIIRTPEAYQALQTAPLWWRFHNSVPIVCTRNARLIRVETVNQNILEKELKHCISIRNNLLNSIFLYIHIYT